MDSPVKTYSSGMYMRLGFAIAVTVDPDVLLIDEVLAVGDEAFQHRCVGKIQEFKARGKTIVLVSHDLGSIERLCDEAVWLDHGAAPGSTARRGRSWAATSTTWRARKRGRSASSTRRRRRSRGPSTGARWGSREVELTRVQLSGRDGQRALPLRDRRALRRPPRLPRASPHRGSGVRRRHLPEGRDLLLRHQHRGGGTHVREGRRRGRRHHADRAARSGRRASICST